MIVAVAFFAQATLASHYGVYPGAYAHGGYAPGAAYAGPLASPVVLPSGYLADTPEVAALKGAHAAALSSAGAAAAASPDYAGAGHGGWAGAGARYAGPLASPVVLPSGFLADTPEVVALKGAHAAAVANAGAAAGVYGAYGAHGHGYYH